MTNGADFFIHLFAHSKPIMDGDEGIFALSFGGFDLFFLGFGDRFVLRFIFIEGGPLTLLTFFIFVEAVSEDIGEFVGVVFVGLYFAIHLLHSLL